MRIGLLFTLLLAVGVSFSPVPPEKYNWHSTHFEGSTINGDRILYNYGLSVDDIAKQIEQEEGITFKLEFKHVGLELNEQVAISQQSYKVEPGSEIILSNSNHKKEIEYSIKESDGNESTNFQIAHDEVGKPNPVFKKWKDIVYIVDNKKGKKGKLIVRIATSQDLFE